MMSETDRAELKQTMRDLEAILKYVDVDNVSTWTRDRVSSEHGRIKGVLIRNFKERTSDSS